jgi:hypothetical protein
MTDDVELRYEHLGHRDTPARQKRRERLARIQEIFDEPEARSQADPRCQTLGVSRCAVPRLTTDQAPTAR